MSAPEKTNVRLTDFIYLPMVFARLTRDSGNRESKRWSAWLALGRDLFRFLVKTPRLGLILYFFHSLCQSLLHTPPTTRFPVGNGFSVRWQSCFRCKTHKLKLANNEVIYVKLRRCNTRDWIDSILSSPVWIKSPKVFYLSPRRIYRPSER